MLGAFCELLIVTRCALGGIARLLTLLLERLDELELIELLDELELIELLELD